MRETRQAPHLAQRTRGRPAVNSGPAGRVVGGCRLVCPLSAGGLGEVYLAQQLRLGDRPVAVKLVRPEGAAGDPFETRAVEQRFLREGAVLGALAHPNILPVHDSGLDDGYLYLVMHYAPDGSLADAIKGRGPLRLRLPVGISLAADLIVQIAAALQYTHDHGVVHRDVKPGNILLEVHPDGRWHVMLADFGIARGVESTADAQQVSGTVAYMAPEQLTGHFSPASDQYALGVIAFLLLTGRTPFLGDVAEQVGGHLYQTPPPIRTLNSAIPLELAEAVFHALNKNPADRWPSVAAFAKAFRRAAPFANVDTARTVATPTGASAIDHAPGRALARIALPPTALPALLAGADYAANTTEATRRDPPGASETTLPLAGPSASAPAPAPPQSARRPSKSRRRLAVFAATVALLLMAVLAGVALKDRVTSRGAQRPRYTASAGEGPTYTPAGPTIAPTLVPGGSPTVAPSATSTPTAVQPPGSPDQAAVGAVIAPETVHAGQIETVRIPFANTGTSAWSAADGYTFVCDTVGHPDAACHDFPIIGLGSSAVQPGQSLTFTVNIKAPSAPGTYRTYWNLAHNGQVFNTPDAAVALTVVPAPAPTATPVPTSPPASPSPPATAVPATAAATFGAPSATTAAPPSTPNPKPTH